MPMTRWMIAALLCSAASATSAVNIIQNPDFDQADADWQSIAYQFGTQPLWTNTPSPGEARTGCAGASCLAGFGQGAYLRQWLPTVKGETYDLNFWVRSFSGVGEYAVYWDGVRIDDQVVVNGLMRQQSYSSLAVTSSMTPLEIHGRNDASFIYFDNFMVQQASGQNGQVGSVPEPMGWLMLAAGLGVLAYAMPRRLAKR
jgi:hypothetical protein